jgi:hypothetical protein
VKDTGKLSLAGLAVAAGLVCGCGGDDTRTAPAQAAPSVSMRPVVACLRRTLHHGTLTRSPRELDRIARRAQRGAVLVRFGVTPASPKGTNVATVVLEGSNAAAAATEARYRAVYKALGGDPRGLLTRADNAVVAFGGRPAARERAAITRCVPPGP